MRIPILVIVVTLAACTQSPETSAVEGTAQMEASRSDSPNVTSTGDAAGGKAYGVPSDPGVQYALLKIEKGEGGNIIATNRREGASGVSFSRREIDCSANQFRYVGEGATLEQANQPAPNPGEMSDLVDGSISDVASKFACANQ
jgi:hypothetical protein